jgi:TetR/AcrR family transcriptional repressor of nem operon
MDYIYNPFTRLDTRNYGMATFVLERPMRHSEAEKANTHKRIVTIAAKKFREEGLAGIGIADLMKEAALTVGGFYKHFKSRDALVTEAIGSALKMWNDRIDAAAPGGPRITYESLVDDYLSEAHRNHPGMGCPVSALAGDLARSDKRFRLLCEQ